MTDDDLEHARVQLTTAHMVSAGLDLQVPVSLTECPVCERTRDDIARHRLNTAYHDDASNWITCCGDCFTERVAYYRELWAEYYAGQRA